MPDNIVTKIAPEELAKMQEFQLRFRDLSTRYGELYFQSKLISNEIVAIDEGMDALENDRIAFMKSLQEKYGAGSVNITTGEFSPMAPVENNPTA